MTIRPLFLSHVTDEDVADITEWFDKEKNQLWCTDIDLDTGICFSYCYSGGDISWPYDGEMEEIINADY